VTTVRKNIELLLEGLPQDSLADQVVSQLREVDRDRWPKVLKQLLEPRLAQKDQGAG
jgi:hypothetical protein